MKKFAIVQPTGVIRIGVLCSVHLLDAFRHVQKSGARYWTQEVRNEGLVCEICRGVDLELERTDEG